MKKHNTHTHTHARLTALFPGLPRWAGTRKVKPIWTLLKQETVSGSGISWAICKSATRSRQTTTPAPHRSYRPDALPAAQPTVSKHWRQQINKHKWYHTCSLAFNGDCRTNVHATQQDCPKWFGNTPHHTRCRFFRESLMWHQAAESTADRQPHW